MDKLFILCFVVILAFYSCRKAQIVQTRSIGQDCPWVDTSSRHPKNVALQSLVDKYKRKGLPGISLLVKDNNGTWIGAAGKADIKNNIDFVPGTVSKAASITKLFMGTLVFKLMEDSASTGIGYTPSVSGPVTGARTCQRPVNRLRLLRLLRVLAVPSWWRHPTV